MKAINVQIGDRIREGVVLDKRPAWQTSHGKPIGVSVEFTVRDDTFPFSPERPNIEHPQYPADAEVVRIPALNPDPVAILLGVRADHAGESDERIAEAQWKCITQTAWWKRLFR